MTVLCVESGVTYADGVAAIAAEGGVNRTFEVDGSVSFGANISAIQYNLGAVIRPKSGQETQDDGDISVGAQMTGTLTGAVDGLEIRNIRVNRLSLSSAPNAVLRRLIMDGLGGDALVFNDTIDAQDIIIHNTNDGVISSPLRPNSSLLNITVIGATRFGFANGKVNDCVDVNSSNQGYFSERPGSTNLWEHDGSGTNTITESPVTNIFVDYAGGKYGILAISSPGAAGAGGFIQVSGGGLSVTGQTPNYLYAAISASIDLTGSIDISGSTPNYAYSSISGNVDLTGLIDVLGNTPNYNYLALTGQIDLTGQISITGSTVNYPYAAVSGNIDFTGVISITGATASYNYQSINGVTDLTGEISVTGQTSNYSYSAINGSIELGALISVIGNTPDYNYQSVDAVVTLVGEIQVSGSTPNYSYQAISGIVGTGEVQIIGKVTANFKADLYSSGFKPSEITVTFKQ